MYFLTPMCLICLNSKNKLKIMNKKMLKKLLNCIGKPEEFIPSNSNLRKICENCLTKLNTTFDFKKICLKNIIQFKVYIEELERACNRYHVFNTITIDLTDIKHCEAKSSYQNVSFKKEILGESHSKNCEDSHQVTIKNEITEIYEPEVQYLKEELPLVFHKEEILEDEYRKELEDPSEILEQQIHEPSSFENENPGRKLPFSCTICGQHFTRESTLAKHMIIHNEENPFPCPICNKPFKLKTSWKAHILAIHAKEKPHLCDTCNKYFTTKGNLKEHMLTHIGLRPHSCPICERRFSKKYHLNRHMLLHNDQRLYSCTICEKRYNLKGSLEHHMLSHSDVRLYVCSVCGKGFSIQYNLHRHMLIHVNERNYLCSICGKTFIQKGDLNRHMLRHNMQYSCATCKKSFVMSSDLKKHMSVHGEKTPHFCSICGTGFVETSELKAHVVIHTA